MRHQCLLITIVELILACVLSLHDLLRRRQACVVRCHQVVGSGLLLNVGVTWHRPIIPRLLTF